MVFGLKTKSDRAFSQGLKAGLLAVFGYAPFGTEGIKGGILKVKGARSAFLSPWAFFIDLEGLRSRRLFFRMIFSFSSF
jgi:hypothetical protein